MSNIPEENSRNGRGRMLAIAMSLIITAAFGVVAVYFIDWNAFIAACARISPPQIIILSLLGFIPILLRVLRLCIAIGQPLQWTLFRAVTLQGAAIATLPAKIGEAVLPLALVRQASYSLPEAVGVLLLLRLYDLLTLLVIGGAALALLAEDFGLTLLRPVLMIGAASAMGAMVLFPLLATFISGQLPKYLDPKGKIVCLLDQLSSASRDLSARRLAGLILVSALVWVSLFLVFYEAGKFVEATPGVAASALAGVAGALAFALPVNGLANLGPFEAAWAYVMAHLGIVPTNAIASAVISHFAIIFSNLALAGLGVLHWGGTRTTERLI